MSEACITLIPVLTAIANQPSLSPKCDFILNSPVQATSVSLLTYLGVLGMTCLLESPFYFYASRGRSFVSRLRMLLLCNLATHPFIFFVLPYVFSKFQIAERNYIAIAEFFAPTVEFLMAWKVYRVEAKLAFLTMFLSNLFSWTIGAVLMS